MRIIHFLLGRCNPDTANGVEKTVYYLSKIQAKLGHDVSIYSITPKEVIPIDGVDVRGYSPARLPFLLPRDLVRNLLAQKPDIVHFHSAFVPENIALSKHLNKAGIPYTITPNGNFSNKLLQRKKYLKWPYKHIFQMPYANKAVFVHSVGDTDSIKDYGIRVPVVLAPNGIDPGTIPPPSRSGTVANRLKTYKNHKLFVYIGRLDIEQKGLDLMFKAFEKALKKNSNLLLLLVGPDWKGGQQRLEQMKDKLHLNGNVVFWGSAYDTEKFDLLYSADFFIHTSRWEGLSLSVLEALALGKPCLVSHPADPMGLIGEYQAGITYDTDPDEIAQALLTAAGEDDVTLSRFSSNAKRMIQEKFNWLEITQQVLSAYEKYVPRHDR